MESFNLGDRAMVAKTEAFVGIDAAKLRNAVAIAEEGRDGEIRYLGEVDASGAPFPPLRVSISGLANPAAANFLRPNP